MKKILLFGSTGNTGAYLADYLHKNMDKDKYELLCIGRKSTDFFKKTASIM